MRPVRKRRRLLGSGVLDAIVGIAIMAALWPILEACNHFLGVAGPLVLASLIFIGVLARSLARMR
jgi:hypothetical protein